MKILLLGGTRDALAIARSLIGTGHSVLYSIAGVAGQPDLDCQVRVGGFGGRLGLANDLVELKIDCVIDATHPYAATISAHAVFATRVTRTPLFRYTRPPWLPQPGDSWIPVPNNWVAIAAAIRGYQRPFFTIGREPLGHIDDIRRGQHWLVRTLAASDTGNPNLRVLRSQGPFERKNERALMLLSGVDILVSKNSGGTAVAAKIEAARDLQLPVIMLQRPDLASTEREFENPDALIASLERLQ